MNLTIGNKLFAIVGILLVLFLALGITAFVQIRTINGQIEQIVEVEEPTSSAAYEMDINLLRIMVGVLGYLEDANQDFLDHIESGKSDFRKYQSDYATLAESDKGKSLGSQALSMFNQMEDMIDELTSNKDMQDSKFRTLLDNTKEVNNILDDKIQSSISITDPEAAEKSRMAMELEINIVEMETNVSHFLLTGDEDHYKEVQDAKIDFENYLNMYKNLALSANERQWAAQLTSLYDEIDTLSETLMESERQEVKTVDRLIDIREELGSTILYQGIIVGIGQKDLQESEKEAAQAVAAAYRNIIIIFLIGAAFGIVFGYLLSKSITVPLQQAVDVADQISNGDLDVRIETTKKDETGQLLMAMKRMVAYIKNIANIAENVAEGDLRSDVQPKSPNDVLSHSFKKMMNNLRTIVQRISESSDLVASTSEQLGSASRMIREGAEEQASATEETSSSIEQMATSIREVASNTDSLSSNVTETSSSIEEMTTSIQSVAKNAGELTTSVDDTSATIEEMAASIEQVAVNAREVSKSSESAVNEAEDGGEAVQRTVEGMEQISDTMRDIVTVIKKLDESSKKINSIVDVIDDIAEQTNLLALNAAIEAARAGEHGRGFAVVADEVRKLAERSASSAKEIVSLITDVQKDTSNAIKVTDEGYERASEGVQLATKAGEALNKISRTIRTVNNMMSEVSKVTDQQAKASDRIVKTVENMRRMTQQVDSATTEQAKTSQQIMKSVEVMNNMTKQVSSATREQKRGGEQVVKAIDNIARISSQNRDLTVQLVEVSNKLSKQGEELRQITGTFKV